jgi:hypothetical protein
MLGVSAGHTTSYFVLALVSLRQSSGKYLESGGYFIMLYEDFKPDFFQLFHRSRQNGKSETRVKLNQAETEHCFDEKFIRFQDYGVIDLSNYLQSTKNFNVEREREKLSV